MNSNTNRGMRAYDAMYEKIEQEAFPGFGLAIADMNGLIIHEADRSSRKGVR